MNYDQKEEQERSGTRQEGRPGESQVPDIGSSQGDRPRRRKRKMGKSRSIEGAVYFIQTSDGKFVKIGFSKNQLTKRMQTVQHFYGSVFGRDMVLLGSVPGNFKTEKWLHSCFSTWRFNGEWFHTSAELLQFVKSYAVPTPPPEEDLDILPPVIKLDASDREFFKRAGARGGKKRKSNMSPEDRTASARKASLARWSKRPTTPSPSVV